MSNTVSPHEVIWTTQKSENFWSYVSQNAALQGAYFGRQAGKSVIKMTEKHIPLTGRIVDYGCGIGGFMEHLLQAGIACEGVDFSEDSLKTVQQKFGDNKLFRGVTLAVTARTPIDNESVDVVFLLETIEHLLTDQLTATIKEMHRMLRTDGYVVITTPNDENLEANKVMCPECGSIFHRWQHVRSFNANQLEQIMTSLGFQTVICTPTLFGINNNLLRFLKIALTKIRRRRLGNLIYVGRKLEANNR